MAWWTAQIQSQIRLHVGSATLDPISRLAARLHSARLNSARLAADDMAGWVLLCRRVSWRGMPTVHADVTITSAWHHPWHAYFASWHHNYVMLMSSWACLLYMLTSHLHHANVINIRVSHMGRVNWYSGRVSPSGRRRHVWRVAHVYAHGQPPRRCVTARADVFDAIFTSGFVSSSSTQW